MPLPRCPSFGANHLSRLAIVLTHPLCPERQLHQLFLALPSLASPHPTNSLPDEPSLLRLPLNSLPPLKWLTTETSLISLRMLISFFFPHTSDRSAPRTPLHPSLRPSILISLQHTNKIKKKQRGRIQGEGPRIPGPGRPRLLRRMVRSLQGHRPQARPVQRRLPPGQVLQDRRGPALRRGRRAGRPRHAHLHALQQGHEGLRRGRR